MAGTNNITAQNAVYLLSIPTLYTTPQQLQQFETDDAFDTETVTIAEVEIGVDGNMVAGSIPFIVPQTLYFQASSPSLTIFDRWVQAQANGGLLFANATIRLVSIGMKFDLRRGALTSGHIIPPVKKVLKARSFKISWNTVTPSPI